MLSARGNGPNSIYGFPLAAITEKRIHPVNRLPLSDFKKVDRMRACILGRPPQDLHWVGGEGRGGHLQDVGEGGGLAVEPASWAR